ncbi:Piezo-type mechanosensitive ion channel-like protein [Thalictrum thalictroides]|uniref:Piezo-type mechanosensitive ion channel-like protein n=1 Tax=Thalictrum thalictroides TaxID=46969 RepID=A0A7J6VM89_THATH|nr:Piezo-type mechanosensitive ion channel-like protein [Thalictrum thalictroides]
MDKLTISSAVDKEETKVLIVATVAWGLRRSSRAITLMLIFVIAIKPGFIHALYMVFFLIFLLSHTVSGKILQSLILLCEAHFALLYILQLDLVSKALEGKDSLTMESLSQLGLQYHASSLDFLQIAVLLCFCAVHNHGFKMLFSFSAIVQHSPYPPIGFSILRAGLNKSVLLSVYASSKVRKNRLNNSSHERRIATYLSVIGQTILSAYHSCGAYVAFLTILITVYLMSPNYISFGYLFFLLNWIIGRQLMERTRRRLWFPLKVYANIVFILIYSLSIFTSFQIWLSGRINLNVNFGYDPKASLLQNVWKSLAVLIVMQLYSYERSQSKYNITENFNPSKPGMLEFMRRLLIWHSEKILSLAVFYSSLSPVGAFGFIYLLGLVIFSPLPKASRVPSKLFLAYTGLLVIVEYLYQMWGNQVGMFPGQKHASLALVLGLQLFKPGFWGLELGLRGKVLVIVACTLQYNAFHWLEKMPSALVNKGKWEEPCPLFISAEDTLHVSSICTEPSEASSLLKRRDVTSNSWPYYGSVMSQGPDPLSNATNDSENGRHNGSFGYAWGSSDEGCKWNKKKIHTLRKERLEMQKTAIKIYLKFWMENMFRLFGLEINMVALLLASFALLNIISLLYIASLAACILLRRCLLRFIVDDPRMLASYYIVFMLACFKLRADHLGSFSESHTYHQVMSQRKNALFWRDISFETKSLWTIFDYLRLYCYCHLLDIVLALILITGTLEYDILHIGYLGFALVFFRIRLQILKKKNKIFKFLRMYNFTLIVLSLAYQSPFLGKLSGGKCGKIDYIYEMIGFYKYDYGFRIASRSALVEIIIFMLVSLQSYMFSSQDFSYISRYLEAEQIGAVVHEQEKKAAWKTAQLLHIRESEELRCQRNLQVEKIKSEMLNLQVQLQSVKSTVDCGSTSPENASLRHRRHSSVCINNGISFPDKENIIPTKKETEETDSLSYFETHGSPTSTKTSVESTGHTFNSLCEITELIEKSSHSEILDLDNVKEKRQKEKSPLISAVQLLGDGVSQVQSIGNQAVANLVSYLNISHESLDVKHQSPAEDAVDAEIDSYNRRSEHLGRVSSVQRTLSESTSLLIGKIFHYIRAQMQSNNDVSSITATDGDWVSLTQFNFFKGTRNEEDIIATSSWKRRIWKMFSLVINSTKMMIKSFTWYWKSLTQGAESPPHFLQLSMEVKSWPENGIQPEKIESAINELLIPVHDDICKERNPSLCHSASRVRVQSIERSQENPTIVLVVFEVVYPFPLPKITTEWFESFTPAADVAKELLKAQRAGIDVEIGFPYPIISVIGGGRREIDLYAYIFGTDLAVFFLVAIFYHSIIKNSNELLEVYHLEDQFPKEYVFILMVLFFLIMLDRIIYLCSFAMSKVIFYLFNLILFTYFVTKYAWSMEPSNKYVGALAIRAIFLTKAISLALQAIQIRYGVHHKSTLYQQFLTSKVSRINFLGFQLYRALPFLYELRCVLDWSCTTTSLTMYDWLKLEDIHSSLYLVKCDVDLNRAKHQQGQKQTNMTKFCNGICLFFILICVIWAPMLMYSSGNPTNIANPIKDASVQIDIKTAGGRLTMYQTTLCESLPWDHLQGNANMDPERYLDDYNVNDIQLICCQPDASTLWLVPPVILARFVQSITVDMIITFSWVLTRDRPKGKEVVKYEIMANSPNTSEVQAVFNGTANSFRIYDFYPRYFRVTGSGDFRLLEQTVDAVSGDLTLNRGTTQWWSFNDINASDVGGCVGLTGPMAIVVSEETPQGILGETLSKFSIWGLYITFVLAVGRFIRLQCSDLRMRIPFENLPSCDRLIAICEDIYAARAEGELEVEEALYWTLVKIYRSPHMLLEYTKPD